MNAMNLVNQVRHEPAKIHAEFILRTYECVQKLDKRSSCHIRGEFVELHQDNKMKIPPKHFMAFALATSITAIAAADGAADFKKWYVKESPNVVKAMESKNLVFFEQCTTSDFTYNEHGKINKKKEALAGLKQMMDTSEKLSYKFKIESVKAGNGGMVVGLLNEYSMTMKPGPDKKKHVMWMEGRTRETWVKSRGTWLLKNITDVGEQKMKMDGKASGG
jgi:hypothetical protein